jgi:hypothetical protein
MVPHGEDAKRELADRAGRFVLLPTAPDLLLARRMPPAGGAPPEPRCILSGDIGAVPIADFVGFMHQARVSGVLTVCSSGVDRSIAFKDGEVRNAQSDAAGERIGEVALRLGYINEEQLSEAAAQHKPVSKFLVEKSFISANDLWKCFHEQVTAVFHSILLSREGIFLLVDEKIVDRPGTPLAVNTQSLLMDGIRRIDEMSLFRAKIPSTHAFLKRREPKRIITLKTQESQLLELVNGERTVAQVAAASHLSEFDATKILYHLAEAGYVQAVGDSSQSGPLPIGASRPEMLVNAMNAIFRDIAGEASKAGKSAPFLEGARSFLADPIARFGPLWKAVEPAPDASLDPAKLLENAAAPEAMALEPTGDRVKLLHDGLYEYMFFLLFQAGEQLPREADEALGRRVKERYAALEGLH